MGAHAQHVHHLAKIVVPFLLVKVVFMGIITVVVNVLHVLHHARIARVQVYANLV